YREDYNPHTRYDINDEQKIIKVLRHAETSAGDPNPQARLGVGRYPYSASSGTKSGSSSVKSKSGVSTNVLSKSNHTHGGGYNRIICIDRSRVRLWFSLRKSDILCRGSFNRKPIQKTVFVVSRSSSFKLLPDSPSVVAHGTTAGHDSKITHASPTQRNTSYVTTP